MAKRSMNELYFWQKKILQLLHDPPAKPYESIPGAKGKGRGGHEKVAKKMAALLTGVPIKYFDKILDLALAGADRPLIHLDKKQNKGQISVRWPKNPVVTHPLSPGYSICLNRSDIDEETAGVKAREEILEIQDQSFEEIETILKSIESPDETWKSPELLFKKILLIWRLQRHILINSENKEEKDPLFNNLWQLMPADSRSPDHSIWEHNRVASALSFMTKAKKDDAPRAPWFFKFEIGPVGRFINDARTSRDLWMGSFLLSDLIWHGMKPVVEHYGPDSIIYPDLCENPRADVWLKKNFKEFLPENYNPFTYAAVLPNTFTAIIPFGEEQDDSHMVPIKELAALCEKSMKERWKFLGDFVKEFIRKETESDGWFRIWERQHENALFSTWSAIRWSEMEKIKEPESLNSGNALPCQEKKESNSNDDKVLKKREVRLKNGFVSDEVYAHYNQSKYVFAKTNLNIHQMERGFDYALTHHQLRKRHEIRKCLNPEKGIFDEYGEKCTVCGKRQALYSNKIDDKLHTHRSKSRAFWNNPKLNPDPFKQDRLCSICATKRFLVQACKEGDNLAGINEVWAGPDTTIKSLGFNDNTPRVPFPSTTLLACQKFMEDICGDEKLKGHVKDVVDACREAHIPKTSFASSLKRLAELEKKVQEPFSSFLNYDVQQVIFPETIDMGIRNFAKQNKTNEKKALENLKTKVQALRAFANKQKISSPNTSIAIVRMDGDNMGKLLLGDPEIIKTKWKDIIHPDAIDSKDKTNTILKNETTINAGWPDHLEAKRLMGPSLHSFISRALAVFSHKIVPWVVEVEFPGRLIYSGGDDVLAMVPSNYAVSMAARIQQLFSAPYIIDTMPEIKSWYWRNKNNGENTKIENPETRFVIPKKTEKGSHILLPVMDSENLEDYIFEGNDKNKSMENLKYGQIIPMLGKAHSLSAGIAFGHSKNPVQGLLNQSDKMLNKMAKKYKGKSCVGISHFSRSGVKTEFVMPWSHKNEFKEDESNIKLFNETINGFQKGILPGRLPYKLGEYREIIQGAESDNGNFIKGLFNTALETTSKNKGLKNSAFKIWKLGMEMENSLETEGEINWADGLFIAKNLSSIGEDK